MNERSFSCERRTRRVLARRIGVAPSTLGRWERDQRRPAPEYLRRLEGVLGEAAGVLAIAP